MIIPVAAATPVILILHNQKLDRWHPILFWECPLPSESMGEGEHRRWKSKGHHTTGLATLDEARACVQELARSQHEQASGDDVYFEDQAIVPWSGEDTPAMVEFFRLDSLTKFTP